MTAKQIMNYGAEWETLGRTVSDCHYAIIRATDYADWRESGVLCENALDARGIMQEAMK